MTPIILEVLKETLSIGDKKEKVKKKKAEKQTNNNMSTTKKLSILFLLEDIYIYIFFFLRKCFHRTLFLLPLEFPNWNGININIIIILAI